MLLYPLSMALPCSAPGRSHWTLLDWCPLLLSPPLSPTSLHRKGLGTRMCGAHASQDLCDGVHVSLGDIGGPLEACVLLSSPPILRTPQARTAQAPLPSFHPECPALFMPSCCSSLPPTRPTPPQPRVCAPSALLTLYHRQASTSGRVPPASHRW